MRRTERRVTVAIGLALLVPSVDALAQQVERDVAVVSEEVAGGLEGYSYVEGPESKLDFHGTALTLAADGRGEVEFQNGRARVAVSVRKLPSPGSLGPYTTYVLWAVTADGRANNLGAIEVVDGRGGLKTSTPFSQFALIVTAEPYFAVTVPSRAVVLRNLARRVRGERVPIPHLAERLDYSAVKRQSVPADSKQPLEIVQAQYAVDAARRAGAEELAVGAFTRAEELLAEAMTVQKSRKYSVRKTAPRIAREAVQIAEDARVASVTAKAKADLERAAREAAEERARLASEQAQQEAEHRAREAATRAAAEAERRAREEFVGQLNRVLPTHETDRGVVAEIAGVQFAAGAAELGMGAREVLSRFAGIVSLYPSMRFKVEGHTDSIGSLVTNEALSLRRAIAVRDYLIGQGIPAYSIDVAGLGAARPVADNETAEGRARNRRVEIVITGGPIVSRTSRSGTPGSL